MSVTKTARKPLSAIGAQSQKTNVLSLPDLTSVDPNLPKWVNSKFKHPKQKIRIGTLFSGIGAVEHALERLGLNHEIVFAGDIDPFVKKSYLANHKISEKNWHTI